MIAATSGSLIALLSVCSSVSPSLSLSNSVMHFLIWPSISFVFFFSTSASVAAAQACIALVYSRMPKRTSDFRMWALTKEGSRVMAWLASLSASGKATSLV